MFLIFRYFVAQLDRLHMGTDARHQHLKADSVFSRFFHRRRVFELLEM